MLRPTYTVQSILPGRVLGGYKSVAGISIALYKAHFGVLLWKRVMETFSVLVCRKLFVRV